MYIRILLLSLFLCNSYVSSAQKLWKHVKKNCIPTDLSKRTLLFPITAEDGTTLKYDYKKAKAIFKKYYPYKYAFVQEDSMKNMDSISSYYALRKHEVENSYASGITNPAPMTIRNTTYEYVFTKGDSVDSQYEAIEIKSSIPCKTLRMILKNIYYEIPSNKPVHCFKINAVSPLSQFTRIGISYECLIHRKTSLGMYVEAGSWKYPSSSLPLTNSEFVLFQPQLIRYLSLFKNIAYDGFFLGIAPFLFYSSDHFKPSSVTTEQTKAVNGYGIRGMIGCQTMLGKRFLISAWFGPQYNFNTDDKYDNNFLFPNYPARLTVTGKLLVGFVLK